MDLYAAMTSTPSCRYFTDQDVPHETLHRVLDHARFASSGGNRQGWRVMVLTDPERRRQVSELHRKQWDPYFENALEGIVGFQGDGSGKRMEHGSAAAEKRLRRTDDFAKVLHEVPVLLVAYVELATLAVTDQHLDRQSVVGGGSLYTLVQNILLGCTAEGLGTALTTLLAAEQPDVDAVLGVPEGYALGALIAVGWPVEGKQYTKLTRKPVEEIAFHNDWGQGFGPAH